MIYVGLNINAGNDLVTHYPTTKIVVAERLPSRMRLDQRRRQNSQAILQLTD